ncbi:MAG: DNA-binding protein [Armatimonadota bacterium]|nr:DNA-binding protein [Armatimonadota bacterium]
MKAKLINDGPEKTWSVIFETGDEFYSELSQWVEQEGLHAAHLTAVGAFERATLGYFDWQKKDYVKIPIHEQVEVLSLVGDIATLDGKPKLHAHVVVGKRDGTAHGGHVLEAHVRPTLEVILTEPPGHLRKKHDAETGLALIDLDGS